MTENEKELTVLDPKNNILDEDILEIDLIKEEYNELNYDLPDFDKLCEDFDIEKAFDKKSSYLLREIRKTLQEKISAFTQLLETILNPGNAPMFILTALKNLNQEDSQTVKDLYNTFAKAQLTAIRLDTIYNEQQEAEYINTTFNNWQEQKGKIDTVLKKLEEEKEEAQQKEQNVYFN